MVRKIQFLLGIFFIITSKLAAQTGTIEGIATDKKTGETIIGAIVSIPSLNKGTSSDFDGKFKINGLSPGKYSLKASYLSYEPIEIADIEVVADKTTPIAIIMTEMETQLTEVVVTGIRRSNTEIAMLQAQKTALTVTSGVSSQQITRTQDKDASEVIKRIPGISIIDDQFVIARGLSQRYNNVWINNSAVPSSEADSRSFSFDIIPSSQIENIVIVKSPSPELPADFSGGFIKIQTKNMPSENSFQLSYGTNLNTKTQFHDFKYNKGSQTDFLGFDNGYRDLKRVVPERLNGNNPTETDITSKEGFNNNWTIHTKQPLPDQRISATLNRKFNTESGKQWGLISALSYSHSNRIYDRMKNTQYGIYNVILDTHEAENDYLDNQYISDSKVGVLLNLSLLSDKNHKFEFRNIFNQSGKNRYTERTGYEYNSGKQEQSEYLYNSRMSYNGQFSGNHTLTGQDDLDWTFGFSYADKNQPDRRIIKRQQYLSVESDPYNGLMSLNAGGIMRDFYKMDEYMYAAGVNYTHEFNSGYFNPTLKAGAYGEFRDRAYNNRQFNYLFGTDLQDRYNLYYADVIKNVLIPENYGYNKLQIDETTNNADNYKGNNLLLAGYLAVNIPAGKLNIYAGARFEYNDMKLTNYITRTEQRTKEKDYLCTNIFPSINMSYNFDKKKLLRVAYGMSANRPEFREISPASYYDFDLFNRIMGNPDLKTAYIQNADLRYEFYPSPSELISVALFYKHFKDPIEWSYIYTGGGARNYTFENAEQANNFGAEIDIKKNLDFAGMKDFSLVLNASVIESKVKFPESSIENNRPMQGQSPYLLNAGFFYQNEKCRFTAGFLYNIIGKRIVGIGKNDSSENSSINNVIPDMYEMPRNVLDLSVHKKFGKTWEISAAARDILAQNVVFKQFPEYYDAQGNLQKREQITKLYKPGQNISLSVKLNF
ncbi:MAG: outer membrane beta-barrel protein [Dysgonamonadaceae bacterium]|jgi:hypothetical protein|nr:outer membrane beta-barrel protein [Dysgonamonadaceae bacterium]